MFDVAKTHVRDPRSGRVIAVRAYRKIIEKDTNGGGTTEYFEFPRGSKIYYNPDKTLNQTRSAEGLALQAAAAEKERLLAVEAAKSPEQKHADALVAAKELLDAEYKKQAAAKAASKASV